MLSLASLEENLFVGGYFWAAGGKPSHYIARWTDLLPSDAPTAGPTSVGVPRIEPWPSPFEDHTVLRYQVGRPGHVRLAVHDAQGARLATLVESERGLGTHTVEWNGRTDRGAPVPAGVYYLRLETPDGRSARKLVRIR